MLPLTRPVLCCLAIAASLLPAAERTTSPYLEATVAYADAMIARGRDRYGEKHSPLFAAVLDRKTMSIEGTFRGPPGVRGSDRSVGGANPQCDVELYQALYRLTGLTGEKGYAEAADAALKYFFEHCQSEATGLMTWGEHLCWNLAKDARGGSDGKHEICGEWPLWNACYRLAPEASWRFAIGQWDHQVKDKETGDFSRHARWSRHGPGGGNDFPRYVGQMVADWADAYARPENAKRERRGELLVAIAVLAGRMERSMARTKTGYLPAHWGRDYLWPASNLEMARCFWRAAPRLPEELGARLRRLALAQDTHFQAMPHRVTEGGGFVETLHTETGEPRSRSMNKPFTSLWVTGYGHATHADTALLCHARLVQLGAAHPELAAGYRKLVLAAAVQYRQAEKIEARVPGALAGVVELMLAAHGLTGDAGWLERARAVADEGIARFLDGGSPLPRAATGLDHYETITGGPAFMAALLNLHEALAPSGAPGGGGGR